MQIKNTSNGPRGFNAINGPVLLNPGEETTVKVFKREEEHMRATNWFDIDGDFEPNPGETQASQVTVTNSDGKDGVYIPASEFNAMREGFERQNAEISRLQGENDDLRKQIGKGEEPDERTALKKQADDLEIAYARNISTEKLKELVDAEVSKRGNT